MCIVCVAELILYRCPALPLSQEYVDCRCWGKSCLASSPPEAGSASPTEVKLFVGTDSEASSLAHVLCTGASCIPWTKISHTIQPRKTNGERHGQSIFGHRMKAGSYSVWGEIIGHTCMVELDLWSVWPERLREAQEQSSCKVPKGLKKNVAVIK